MIIKNNMKIIIGLGNPGKKYQSTRHNAGFMVLDNIAKLIGQEFITNKKFNAEFIKQDGLILFKPLAYMNESGQSVQNLLSFYGLLKGKKNSQPEAALSETITVIHDDLDIDLGKFKISVNSRSAGHNGVQSIIEKLGTKNFKRIRIGIKKDDDRNKKIPTEAYVLQKFDKEELIIIKKVIAEILLLEDIRNQINNSV
jgi:peptidyl-tRNA hydrolase, PTH1 family